MTSRNMIPLAIGLSVACLLYASSRWWGFLLIFPWIGGWITAGCVIAHYRRGLDRQLGRRISLLAIMPLFIVFIGAIQRENLQLEELVVYLSAGYLTRVVIHYALAKIIGPLGWARGFCGWACWHAAVFEWLPIKTNRKVKPRLALIRWFVLAASVAVPVVIVAGGYDARRLHLDERFGKEAQYDWFLAGNAVYYVAGVALAFALGKKRAFCKVACPVSLVMKPGAALSSLRKKPTGAQCTECGICDEHCPMDVPVMSYISRGGAVRSTECVLCDTCSDVCPTGAIQ